MRTLSVALFSLVALAIGAKSMEEEKPELTPLQTIAGSTSVFAAKFLKDVISNNPGNLICSPLSAQIVLAMAGYGAGGDTASEMRGVLGVPEDDQLGQEGYKAFMETLNSVENVTLDLANKMYVAEGFPVKPPYKAITANSFLSECQSLNFANAVGAAGTINAWCEEKTHNRIKDVINPDSINGDTKMVLVNAVYFKGDWQKKFDPDNTQDRPFHIDEHTTKDVPTMYIESDFRYGNAPSLSASIIELPYKNDELSMVIILPNEHNGLQNVVDNLDKVNISQILAGFRSRKVKLYLPKFKIESTLPLKEPLQRLGMRSMFGPGANFSGITDVPLEVSSVLQKAFIEVNEEGSEAAAVTVIQFVVESLSDWTNEFKVNQPFLYSVIHQRLGGPLFSGIVGNPKI